MPNCLNKFDLSLWLKNTAVIYILFFYFLQSTKSNDHFLATPSFATFCQNMCLILLNLSWTSSCWKLMVIWILSSNLSKFYFLNSKGLNDSWKLIPSISGILAISGRAFFWRIDATLYLPSIKILSPNHIGIIYM